MTMCQPKVLLHPKYNLLKQAEDNNKPTYYDIRVRDSNFCYPRQPLMRSEVVIYLRNAK